MAFFSLQVIRLDDTYSRLVVWYMQCRKLKKCWLFCMFINLLSFSSIEHKTWLFSLMNVMMSSNIQCIETLWAVYYCGRTIEVNPRWNTLLNSFFNVVRNPGYNIKWCLCHKKWTGFGSSIRLTEKFTLIVNNLRLLTFKSHMVCVHNQSTSQMMQMCLCVQCT
jgi:hypothetical protein